jgi:hypothetical protein
MNNNTTQDPGNTRLLSRRELAARWSMSTQTVRQRERCGMITPLRLGGAARFKLSDIEKIEAEAARGANEDRRRERQSRKTYFAVVCGDGWGYILDAYPEERLNYLRELGKDVIGEFGTQEEANACVVGSLTTKNNRKKTKLVAA